jgi:CRP-like cAMP-binding protein
MLTFPSPPENSKASGFLIFIPANNSTTTTNFVLEKIIRPHTSFFYHIGMDYVYKSLILIMKELTDFIQLFGKVNEQQVDYLVGKSNASTLPRNAYFSQAGKVPRQIAFVLEGVLRFCYYNNKGQEITHYFVGEGQFITDYAKFEAQSVACEYIQAVTSCKMLVFSKDAWDDVGNTIVGWENIESKMVKKCLNESIERRSRLLTEDATSRYLTFLKDFERIANRIPLSYIASYLGITQQSLSRIRKNIR